MEARVSCQLNASLIYLCLGPGLANFCKAPERNDPGFLGLSNKAEKQPGQLRALPRPVAGERPDNPLERKQKTSMAESPCNFTAGS